MHIYDKDSSCTHSDVLSDYHTITYPLRAMWNIRSQHFLINFLCQPLRFVLQFFHPAFSLSLSAVLIHVVFCLPRLRRPSGVQVNAVLHSFGSFLTMWLKWISISFTRTRWGFLSQPSVGLLCLWFFPISVSKYPSRISTSEDVNFISITFIYFPVSQL